MKKAMREVMKGVRMSAIRGTIRKAMQGVRISVMKEAMKRGVMWAGVSVLSLSQASFAAGAHDIKRFTPATTTLALASETLSRPGAFFALRIIPVLAACARLLAALSVIAGALIPPGVTLTFF